MFRKQKSKTAAISYCMSPWIYGAFL